MVKKCVKYQVEYVNNIFGNLSHTMKSSKTKATKDYRGLVKMNKISEHNSKVIRGKPFKLYKNIKLKKVSC